MRNLTQRKGQGVFETNDRSSDHNLTLNQFLQLNPLSSQTAVKAMGETTEIQSGEALCQVAADMLNHGKAQMAADYCLMAIRTQPTAKAYKLLGDSFQQLQAWTEAEQAYCQSLHQDPEQAETYANLGSLYARQHKWPKALDCYQKTLALKPELTTIGKNIEYIWQQIRQSDDEINQLYERFVAEPKQFSAPYHFQLGEIFLARQQNMQAIVCYRQALQLEPNWQTAKQRLEQIARQMQSVSQPVPATPNPSTGQPVQMLQGTDPAPLVLPPQSQPLQSSPSSTTIPDSTPLVPRIRSVKRSVVAQVEELLQQGATYLQQQQWEQASQCYKQAVSLHPDHAIAQWQLATVLDYLGQKDAAIEHYFLSLSLDSSQVSASDLCRFGDILKQHNQSDRAINCYQWALLKENKAEIHRQLAEIFSSQEQYESASASYRKAIELGPTWQNYHDLGDTLLKLQQWESAAQAYTQAIQLNSEFSWSHNNLGDALFRLKQWDLAAQAYQQAIALNPNFYWSHYNLGEVYKQQGKWEAAVAAYRNALQNQPGCLEAEERLHEVLHQRAKADLEIVQSYYRQAIERNPGNPDYFHQAIALDPQNAALYLGLAEALMRRRQPDQAQTFYQIALQLDPELKKKIPQFEQFLRELGRSLLVIDFPWPEVTDRSAVIELIDKSLLFDSAYYLRNNPQVAILGTSPVEHYVDQGAWQGCNPNPFFHSAYYLEQNPELVHQKINPLVHYICHGAKNGCEPAPFFDTLFYLGMSPDVAKSSLNPLAHYLHYGMSEGRMAFPIDRILSALCQESIQPASQHLKLLEPHNSHFKPYQTKLKIGVYCNSFGNYFMAEIADFIAAALERVGVTAIRLSEEDERPLDLDDDIVVAPHEFFYLGKGNLWLDHPRVSRSIMVNVEQPHTSWFARAFYILQQARVVLDINVKSAAILEQLGVSAYFFPLGYLSGYAAFTATGSLPDLMALKSFPSYIRHHLPDIDEPLEARPIDVHFIGTLTERREQFFASQAFGLSQFRCFFHIPPVSGPLLQGQDQALTTEAVIGLSRRSKILLNIHREELPYFEWHRIMFHGLWQKTLVVTEPCHLVPGLVPGEHYIECKLDKMADQLNWLLNTTEGSVEAERVRRAGHEVLMRQVNISQTMQNVLDLLFHTQKIGGVVW